jgi:hypothetical protein
LLSAGCVAGVEAEGVRCCFFSEEAYCWLFMRERRVMRGVEKWRSWTREGLSDSGCEMGDV